MGKDGNNETLKEETQILITLLSPFLEEIHSILVRSKFMFANTICINVLYNYYMFTNPDFLICEIVYDMDRLKST